MTYKFNDLLIIYWLDTESNPAWMALDKANQRPGDSDCITCGFFFKKDREFLYISACINKKSDGDRDRITIPLGCIKKVQRLKWK